MEVGTPTRQTAQQSHVLPQSASRQAPTDSPWSFRQPTNVVLSLAKSRPHRSRRVRQPIRHHCLPGDTPPPSSSWVFRMRSKFLVPRPWFSCSQCNREEVRPSFPDARRVPLTSRTDRPQSGVEDRRVPGGGSPLTGPSAPSVRPTPKERQWYGRSWSTEDQADSLPLSVLRNPGRHQRDEPKSRSFDPTQKKCPDSKRGRVGGPDVTVATFDGRRPAPAGGFAASCMSRPSTRRMLSSRSPSRMQSSRRWPPTASTNGSDGSPNGRDRVARRLTTAGRSPWFPTTSMRGGRRSRRGNDLQLRRNSGDSLNGVLVTGSAANLLLVLTRRLDVEAAGAASRTTPPP